MPDFSAYAPGKVILFGEHAVVYGEPALAAPVQQVRARVQVSAGLGLPAGSVQIEAPALNLVTRLADLPDQHPLAAAVRLTCEQLGVLRLPACRIRITSTIPVAAGLGSGAAVSVALVRALSAFLGHPLPDSAVCDLAFEVEKLHHGTPSGIDNTVITYARPVYFEKGLPGDPAAGGRPPRLETLHVAAPFTLLIADTGIASPTAAAVGAVRTAWQADSQRYFAIFHQIGDFVRAARQFIETGATDALGPLMTANHALLQQIGVSSPELDTLVDAALAAGALGAKLSGGGRGGNMLALLPASAEPSGVEHPAAQDLAAALRAAGAVNTLVTTITP